MVQLSVPAAVGVTVTVPTPDSTVVGEERSQSPLLENVTAEPDETVALMVNGVLYVCLLPVEKVIV